MSKRKITDTLNLKFEQFDRYGSVIPGMSWHKMSFNKENGYGTYISKLEPGTKRIPHTHLGFEEFLILEGELIDSDGTTFQKGNFVTFAPGSEHSSYTKKGCLILTFMRGINEPSKVK